MTDCIEWWGTRDTNGYGVLHRRRKLMKAHRVVWEECFGSIPEGLYVCHHCDNPPCVNPAHLFLGTAADNNADMMAKGRAVFPGAPVKTECKNGHPYDGENTGWVPDKRRPEGRAKVCKACRRANATRWYRGNRLTIREVKA